MRVWQQKIEKKRISDHRLKEEEAVMKRKKKRLRIVGFAALLAGAAYILMRVGKDVRIRDYL